MKNLKLFATLIIFLAAVMTSSAITLNSYKFCREISVTNWNNFSEPIKCVEETAGFLTTDESVYTIASLSALARGDKATYEIKNPAGQIINNDVFTADKNLPAWYDVREISIASQNLQPGDYPAKLFINGQEVASSNFIIAEDLSEDCKASGSYCCPYSKICLSTQEGTCASGYCCESEEFCKTFSPSYFTRKEVTNCEEAGLKNCGRVVKLYSYSISAGINPPQTGVIYYRGVDVDCGDWTDVTIAYYDEKTGTWTEKVTAIEETDVKGDYKATALLDYIGYIALIRTDECVPTTCLYGGYRTKPIGAYLNLGETITFELCGMVNGCEAMKNGKCSKQCTNNVDPDCPKCTPAQGDCCLTSYDNKCDTDCAPGVDPDCCDKSKELCCPSSPELSGSQGCDKNCGTADQSCTNCKPQEGDCCNATIDSTCDPDCPKLSNGVGYVDGDCCTPKGIPITSATGDCCNTACDGICDPDCIAGLDPDCSGKGCCGDGACQTSYGSAGAESCYTCEQDCGNCYADYYQY